MNAEWVHPPWLPLDAGVWGSVVCPLVSLFVSWPHRECRGFLACVIGVPCVVPCRDARQVVGDVIVEVVPCVTDTGASVAPLR